MKIFETVKLLANLNEIKAENEELRNTNKKLEKRAIELEKNVDFLITENTTLKQVNRRKYLKYENKMKFLENREKKLQTIEQMVYNKEDFRKIRKFIKEEQ